MKRLAIAAIISVAAAGVFTGCGVSGAGAGTGGQSVSQEAGQTTGQNAGQATGQTTGQDIGSEAALEIALGHAGFSETDVSRIRVTEDRDDGRKLYDVRFDANQTEYDYDIYALDGTILSSDVESYGNASGQNPQGAGAQAAVSREDAMATALARVPGATQNDIRIQLDYDDGRQKYEGDIIYNQMEYDFEIDANTGEVIGWSEERP